jgi:hypothetical protein
MNHAHHETYFCLPTFPEWTIHPPISEDTDPPDGPANLLWGAPN